MSPKSSGSRILGSLTGISTSRTPAMRCGDVEQDAAAAHENIMESLPSFQQPVQEGEVTPHLGDEFPEDCPLVGEATGQVLNRVLEVRKFPGNLRDQEMGLALSSVWSEPWQWLDDGGLGQCR